jgi:Zn-dependent peptidase ImmA (M78 family)
MGINKLFQLANKEHIRINFFPMKSVVAFSMPNEIVINPRKIHSRIELKECMAHELGHHERYAFYSILSTYETKSRQEEKATRWATQFLIPKDEIKKAVKSGCTELWQLAEYFDVSERFMLEAIRVHRAKGNI